MSNEAKKRADAKFNKLHTKLITIRLHNENDSDIIEYLETKSNKQGYIKDLIRKEMNKNNKN